jgi:hypothetical protein
MTYIQGYDKWKHGNLPYYDKDCLGIRRVGVDGNNYYIIVDELTGLTRIEKVEDKNDDRK